jgi:predicted ArsR family transcriptional regulator
MTKTTDKITALLKTAKADEQPKGSWFTPKSDHELPLCVIVDALGMSEATIKRNLEKLAAEHLVSTDRIHRRGRWSRFTRIRLVTSEERQVAHIYEETCQTARLLSETLKFPVRASLVNLGRFTAEVLGYYFKNQTESQVRSLSSLRMQVERQLNDITCPDCHSRMD